MGAAKRVIVATVVEAEMSNRAISWALRQQIPPTPKLVLTVLCNAANDKEGLTCRRSYSYLARETSLNRTTVVHTIQDLIRNSKIEKTGTHSDGSVIYRVLVAHDNQGWLRRKTSRAGQLVVQDNQGDCVQQPLLVADDNRGGWVGQPNNKIKQKNQKKPKPAAMDPRRAAFVALVYETRPNLVADKSDFKALKDLLAATRDKPAYASEKLAEYWNRFLSSNDPFHQRQGKPLRFFCLNINAFIARGNGNGTHHTSKVGDSGEVPGSTSRELTRWGDPIYVPKQ
jgi:hypothetical protein